MKNYQSKQLLRNGTFDDFLKLYLLVASSDSPALQKAAAINPEISMTRAVSGAILTPRVDVLCLRRDSNGEIES